MRADTRSARIISYIALHPGSAMGDIACNLPDIPRRNMSFLLSDLRRSGWIESIGRTTQVRWSIADHPAGAARRAVGRRVYE